MSEIYINNSGNYNAYVDGELDHRANYVKDLTIQNNDDEYFTQLGNDELLDLLNVDVYPMERDNLMLRLQTEFPVKKSKSKKSSKKSKKKKKSRSKKDKRATKRQKMHLIEAIMSHSV